MSYIRPAAVAGMFYPADASELDATVRAMLAAAGARRPGTGRPKAIIAPHAGYIYSGPIAASAYACLRPIADEIRRVVLIGPAHRVRLDGIAVSTAEAFATPLGPVPVDTAAIAEIASLPQVARLEPPHADEHCLEVHLPFLQEVLGTFAIVPMVVGNASGDEVAEVLDRLWGGVETLIVVSSDLSHYLDYDSAKRLDAETTRAIEAMASGEIGYDQACGRIPVAGLLTLARRRGLSVETLDLRNSGDTAGDRRRVVGYGAWLFSEAGSAARRGGAEEEEADARALAGVIGHHGQTMLALAKESIRHGLETGKALAVNASAFPAPLAEHGASFVTLHQDGRLRGCIGSARAVRPLAEDIADNAFAAAFEDHRFPRLGHGDLDALDISVSLLSQPRPIAFADEGELIRRLRPGSDGLIIAAGSRRALFLPQVWSTIPDASGFLAHLKRKAGIADDAAADLCAWRFVAASAGGDTVSTSAG
ncbi:MAG TPA: AmmeMemoRadiSam system protein B [Rhodospirillales bacterium]|nr:AmmeMemoRadiSam system protein B [Rhodospirillales bacterium]